MLTKRGINTTRAEKHIVGVRKVKAEEPSKEASCSRAERKVVTCRSCGAKFEKACPQGYLCEVVNNTCPNCNGTLE
jgi:hypothetical protein